MFTILELVDLCVMVGLALLTYFAFSKFSGTFTTKGASLLSNTIPWSKKLVSLLNVTKFSSLIVELNFPKFLC